MIIDNPDALLEWLEGYLPPLCDADPKVLAKYCLALARKDRNDGDLKGSMVEALDVFLNDNANTFVDVFLSVVRSKSYLQKKKDASPKPENDTENESETQIQPPLPPSPTLPQPPPESPPPSPKKEELPPQKPRKDSEREDRKRRRSSSRNRDRVRRSRSPRGRSGRSRYDERRRRSPHSKRYRRTRSRSRSPRRSRSPARRSHSPTIKRRHRTRSRSPFPPNSPLSPAKDDVEESNSRDETEKDFNNTISGKKQRCRDYDEQGFCMRGDQCPFDHGNDPVVLEGTALEFPPPAYTAPPPILSQPPPRVEYTPSNPSIWNESQFFSSNRSTRFPPTVPPPDSGRELISVHVDGNKHTGPLLQNRNINDLSKLLRGGENCTLELRKIPAHMNTIALLNQHFSKFGNITNIQVLHQGDPEAALVTFSNHPEASSAYRSAEAVLNNRFIKLFWHNTHKTDPNIMHRTSHDRVINRNPNKYICKKPDDRNERVVLMKTNYVKNSLGPKSMAKSEMAVPDSTQHGPTPEETKKVQIEAIQKQQELLKAEVVAKKKKDVAIKLKSEVEKRTKQLLERQMHQVKVLINKLEENRATMKPEELKSLLSTIKTLQASVDSTKSRLAAEPKPVPITPKPSVKSKIEMDKAILDVELELYTIQSEGGDVSSVKNRLQLLKCQLSNPKKSTNTFPYPSAVVSKPSYYNPRGRGGPIRRGRGRGFAAVANAVDRRTTAINASGFEREDREDVLTHFAAYGKVVNFIWEKHTPSISIQYTTRIEAEKALAEGRNLGDRLLTLKWIQDPQGEIIKPEEKPVPHSTTPVSNTEEEETEEIVEVVETVDGDPDEEVLIYDDDDESTDGTDGRSWRR